MLKQIKSLFKLDIDNKNTPYKLVGLVVSVWLLSLIAILISINGWATRGQFGDLFGSINSLFSGLAFAGIIYSIIQQQKQLGLTREDLELTRVELQLNRKEQELSRQEFTEQNDILYLQRFDNTFFNMLTLHHELLHTLSVNISTIPYQGRLAFKQIIDEFNSTITQKNIIYYLEEHFGSYVVHFSHYVSVFHPSISHYLQSLASIYITIDESDLINETDKKYYFKILKSYISFPERRFLFYYLILVTKKDETLKTLAKMEMELNMIHKLEDFNLLDISHHALISKFREK